jgi:hypothetical protein
MLVGLNQVVHTTEWGHLLTLLISNVSWVLINIMTESSECFCKYDRNLGDAFCMMVCVKCRVDLGGVLYFAPTIRNWWKSVGSHGSLLLRMEVALRARTLVRWWLHLLSCFLHIVALEISLQFHRYNWCMWFYKAQTKVAIVEGMKSLNKVFFLIRSCLLMKRCNSFILFRVKQWSQFMDEEEFRLQK